MARNNKKQQSLLQSMCRKYLKRLRKYADKIGLQKFVDDTIKANRKRECEANEKDVEMLARMAKDDRVNRTDVPKILGVTYRECNDKDLFQNIKRITNRGSYSKVSAELYACKLKDKKKDG